MTTYIAAILMVVLIVPMAMCQVPADIKLENPTNPLVKIHTEKGDMFLELFPDVAPKHVDSFLKLTKSGYTCNTKCFITDFTSSILRLQVIFILTKKLPNIKPLSAPYSYGLHTTVFLNLLCFSSNGFKVRTPPVGLTYL